ncbi:MAG: D-aminoacyl-tRNA deacylase [Candidatus Neomarinimicrobiota bacterium]|tara:strand:+ start:16212 stop:16655 length:444 start_codon:yes stop_codon:yes gene_type:complete
MIAVLQRTSKASVAVDDKIVGNINSGLVILLGIKKGDSKEDADYLAQKISRFRMFNDDKNKMNRSILDIQASALVISQFTLCADTKKGRRPSFLNAESPELSKKLYEYFKVSLRQLGILVESGQFGSLMKVKLVNDGPVTFVLDSKE